MKKRLLSVLLCLALALTLLPTAALADNATSVWVGGTELAYVGTPVYATSDGSTVTTISANESNYNAKFVVDGTTATLTLRNFSYEGAGYENSAIYADGDLNIVLEGTNIVTNNNSATDYNYGIQCTGALTISGSGNLAATGGTATGTSGSNYGIYGGSVTITGGTVKATGSDTTTGSSYGIYGVSVTITDATVKATGGAATGTSGDSCGICSGNGVTIKGSATVNATGSTANNSNGIFNYYQTVSIEDSATVNAVGGEAARDSYGIICYGGAVTISGGTVNATGGTADMTSCGIRSDLSSSISGSSIVNATGGTANLTSCGLYGKTVTIGGSAVVNATGGTSTESSYETFGSFGIYGSNYEEGNSVSISGSAVVIATGGSAKTNSYGIKGGDTNNGENKGKVAFNGGITIARAGMVWNSGANEGSGAYTCSPDTSTYNPDNRRIAVRGGSISFGSGNNATQIAGAVGYNGTTFGELTEGAFSNNTIKGTVNSQSNKTATGVVIVPSGWNADTQPNNDENYNVSENNNTYFVSNTAKDALIIGNNQSVSVGEDATLLVVSLYEGADATSGINGSGTMELNGAGKLIAVGGMTTGTSATSSGIEASESLLLSRNGGSLDITAIGGTSADSSFGIYKGISDGGDVTLYGGSVTAIGGTSARSSFGIYNGSSDGDVTLYGGSVTALGGTATSNSFGIYNGSSDGDVTLYGGKVTAIGGVAAGNGICSTSGTITINNSSATAIGATQAMSVDPTLNGAVVTAGAHSGKLFSIESRRCAIGVYGALVPAPTNSWADEVTARPAEAGTDYVVVDGNNVTIKTNKGLAWLAQQVDACTAVEGYTKNVTLATDVNMSAHCWTPIGDNMPNESRFKGTFDGNGKTVSGLYYNGSAQYVGLFGMVGSDGTVKNVNVAYSYLRGSGSGITVGGVVGYNATGTVTDCASSAVVIGAGNGTNNVGGVVGNNSDGTVTSCSNTGSVSATGADLSTRAYAGGVVGSNSSSESTDTAKVTNCSNTGSVSATSGSNNYAGGVVGSNSNSVGTGTAEVTNCYNTGSVSAAGGNGRCAGGVVGENFVSGGTAKVTNCYSAAASVSATHKGGVAGRNDTYAVIENCYYKNGAPAAAIGVGTGTVSNVPDVGLPETQMIAGTRTSGALVDALNAGATAYNSISPAVPAARWWNSGNDYPKLACAITVTPPKNGTLSVTDTNATAVTNAVPDETITVTATPASGYTLSGVTVTKTGDDSQTVPVTNNTFTMPNYPVTVSATFTQSSGGYYVPIDVTVYNDSDASGATAWLTGSGLSKGDSLVTEGLSAGEDYNAMLKLADKDDIINVYNIYLKSGKHSIGSAMYLNFKLGAQYAGQSLTLVHKKTDGSYEYLNATVDAKGDVEFGPLYELSPFMLVKGKLSADTVPLPFTDVPAGEWYYDNVRYVYSAGLMDGVTDTAFAPAGTITRGMIVTILHRMAGEPVVNYAMTFKDVPADMWYTEAVRWAASEKIVDGFDAATFAPENPITREQLAAILYRYAKYTGEPGFTGSWYFPLNFEDAAQVSQYADEAMHWCVMKGLIDGSDGKLLPQGSATRAQAAAVIHRFCVNAAK